MTQEVWNGQSNKWATSHWMAVKLSELWLVRSPRSVLRLLKPEPGKISLGRLPGSQCFNLGSNELKLQASLSPLLRDSPGNEFSAKPALHFNDELRSFHTKVITNPILTLNWFNLHSNYLNALQMLAILPFNQPIKTICYQILFCKLLQWWNMIQNNC